MISNVKSIDTLFLGQVFSKIKKWWFLAYKMSIEHPFGTPIGTQVGVGMTSMRAKGFYYRTKIARFIPHLIFSRKKALTWLSRAHFLSYRKIVRYASRGPWNEKTTSFLYKSVNVCGHRKQKTQNGPF